MGGLTAKQQRFVAEYLKDLNATQAAIRAKYSAKTADRIGPELLGKTCVAEAIRIALERREARTEITQDMVLKNLAKMAFFDVRQIFTEDGRLKPVSEWSEDAAAAIVGVDSIELAGDVPGLVRKIKFADKRAATVDIGKHLGMFEGKEKAPAESNKPGIIKSLKSIMGKG